MSPHVNTMVALSLMNPDCQKINSSGLRRMAGPVCWAPLGLCQRLGQARYENACRDKSEQAQEQPIQMIS
jgi:hypothetical protein